MSEPKKITVTCCTGHHTAELEIVTMHDDSPVHGIQKKEERQTDHEWWEYDFDNKVWMCPPWLRALGRFDEYENKK